MTGTKASRSRARGEKDAQWAELADLILVISREIQFRGYRDPRAIRLTQSEGMVMRYLLDNNSAPPSRIAAAVGLQRTNLSTVLRGLEDKGLIARGPGGADGRGVTVQPTSEGRSNYALVRGEWGAGMKDAAGNDPADLDAALTLLRRIAGELQNSRQPRP